MLMDLPAGILLLRVIDIVMHIALQRAIAAGRVRIQPTARVDGEVSGLLHGLHGEIAGRLEDDRPLATDPGDQRGPVFLVVPPPGLALLAAPTRAAAQRLLAAPYGLALVAGGVIEVIGLDRPCQLAGIVKLSQKIVHLCSKERTIGGFVLVRAPVFSLFPLPQLSSRGRRLGAIFH